jgi:hypothetical protein
MNNLTAPEILALWLQDVGRACLERAEQLLRATAMPESHLTEPADRWLTAKEVAQILRASPDFIYGHADEYPFTRREGKLVRFSARGLDEYLGRGADRPRVGVDGDASRADAASGPRAGPSGSARHTRRRA